MTWIVYPNPDYEPKSPFAIHKRFASCTWLRGDAKPAFLRESGFSTFPIMAPRWDITGEDTYGTDCPGMMALGDNRQLQQMQRKKGQAIAKQVDPPLVGPPSLRSQKTSLLPGDITYSESREGMAGLRPIHETQINLRDMTIDMSQVQQRIQRAFFEDLFLMLQNSQATDGIQPITAREVEERHEEKLLALGPVLERTTDELLDPIVDRTFQMMADAGLLPDIPAELQGREVKPQYTSILAQAMKLVGVTGLDRFLQSSLGLAEIAPEVKDKIKFSMVVDAYQDMLGVDPDLVRSDEEAAALTAQRNQAQADAQQADNAMKVAKATKDASQAPTTGDSVLANLVRGASNGVPTLPVGQAPAAPAGV